MTAAALARSKIDADALRKEACDIVDWLCTTKEEAGHKLVRLSSIAFTVHKYRLWKEWKNPQTDKPYTGLRQWIHVELRESSSSVYRFMAVREHLRSVSIETLEKLGSSRTFELVKIAQDKPNALPQFVRALEKNPEIPLYALKQQVTNTLAGTHRDSGLYIRFEAAIKVEDEQYLTKALAVMQALESVSNPETAAGRGLHLVAMAQEYLSGPQQTDVLKKLEAAGAFDNTPFKIEG